MITFFIENLSTIVVSAIVAGIVILIIHKMKKDKKSNSSCKCTVGCNNCNSTTTCHK